MEEMIFWMVMRRGVLYPESTPLKQAMVSRIPYLRSA